MQTTVMRGFIPAIGAMLLVTGSAATAADEQPSLAPSVTGPLKPSTNPLHVDGGPLGPVYISGVISGLGFTQDRPISGDTDSRLDLTNGQVIVQTASGPIQFYAEAGGYSFPAIGAAYFKAGDVVGDTFGLLPIAYVKIVPTSEFNIQIGKLFTLQGGENTFTFMNFNIERGLLWNQTNAVNRGVQVNYAHGGLSVSVSLNDGFYSGKYNWLSSIASLALTAHDSINVGAAANLGRTRKSSFATPIPQSNGEVYVLGWTHAKGPLTVQSYAQVTRVPKDESLGIPRSASTYGAAVLGKYSFNDQFSLAARAEYIGQRGSPNNGAPSLVYGPGSRAWSLTLTPTWQKGIVFARGEGSYMRAYDVVPGFGLGPDLAGRSQVRGLIEGGLLF